METWIVVGVVAVAVLPRIPGLRRATKETIKGGMTVANKGKDVAVTAGEHWADLVAEAKADEPSDAEVASTNGVVPDQTVRVPVTVDGKTND